MADCDWAALPNHILGLVLNRLLLPDLIKSRAVCKSWRLAAAKEVDPRKAWAPMLMLAGDPTDENSEYRTLFSLSDHEHKFYRLHLPQIRGQRVLGTADGWLVTVDNDTAELQLVNAFTRAVHALPSITTLSLMLIDRRIVYRVDDLILQPVCHMAVLSSSSPLTVLLIYGEARYVAFARAGAKRWTELPWSYCNFSNIMLHKGLLHAVADSRFFRDLIVDISSSPPWITFASFLHDNGSTSSFCHMVESLDRTELLQIRMHECPDHHLKIAGFTVFKMDPRGIEMKLIEVESLEEGAAVFLGVDRAMMLSTKDLLGLQDNCIYFTGKTERGLRYCDVGVFDMKTKKVRPLYPRESPLHLLTWQQPFWLTPCLP